MSNTTTIRALTEIVVVVVLIFTAGSLVIAAAASSSSSTPQPQNLICIHLGNNATCSQGGIIPTTTTQIPLPTSQQQPPATLTIIKHVINDIVGTIFAKDFTSSAGGGINVSSQSSFPGVTTTVTLKPGTFPVELLQQANIATAAPAVPDHNKCSSDDIITCTHDKEIHHFAKDTTTPFVLPIPFP
ncbi:MAG TPA: hypothetical protein VE076_10415 [Nitrososphaeraceae archaeon]|nr:hypothetical protein [Nitrososphaeraceae archaeon]